MYIETTWILDFYIHEDWQRKGHGTQLMDYLMLIKGIPARKISLYKPSKAMLRFMAKNYGLTRRLEESVEVYTFFDILGEPNDGDHKYDLYMQHLKYLNKQRKQPTFNREAGGFLKVGSSIMRGRGLNTTGRNVLNIEDKGSNALLYKSLVFKRNEENKDGLPSIPFASIK